MSAVSKPLTVARLNDVVLGCFSNVPPSDTLNHLARFLGTWNGSDKMFTVLQQTLRVLVSILNLRARLQHRAGLRKVPVSDVASRLGKFASTIGDTRTLWRFWGLFPIFTWLISLERQAQPTRTLLTVERLQGWSMLGYYPLEHLAYLSSHDIVAPTIPSVRSLWDSSAKPTTINSGKLSMWSCRFWALYVGLQFAHLQEDYKLLLLRQRNLHKAKRAGPTAAEKQELEQRWDAYWSQLIINLSDLPLTIHWSLEKGVFKNEIWVSIFGLISALVSFRMGWKATALSSAPSPSECAVAPAQEPEKEDGYDVMT